MSISATNNELRQDSAGAVSSRPRRQVLQAMSGILLGMFVSVLSTSIVSSSLPVIVADLNGSQSAFTWVVTATLLTSTITTPIWGKLADLLDRKKLIQIALIISVVAAALAGIAENIGTHIGFRALQGVGAGGLMALGPVLISDIISPRERGRYMGILGAVTGVAMVGGPVIGGLITDGIGWRWNFFLALPFAIAAIFTLQRTLRLPEPTGRSVRIDYWGISFISAGVAALLLWVTFAGNNFDWVSWQSAVLVGGGLVALVVAVLVELRVEEPLIPMHLFRNRTFIIAVIASAAIGVAMFGSSVFLSQYMQLARGYSPTAAGLASLPTVIGMFAASTISGNLISSTGRYKKIMIGGAAALIAGLVAVGTVNENTPLALLFVFLFVIGAGVGMLMQNLVLVTQNTLDIQDIGSGTSGVAFFRTMGGAMGVAMLGSVLANRVSAELTKGLELLGGAAGSSQLNSIPHLSELPEPVQHVVSHAYGVGVPEIFLVSAPIAVITLIAVCFLKEVPLGTRSGSELREEVELHRDVEQRQEVLASEERATEGSVAEGQVAESGESVGNFGSAENTAFEVEADDEAERDPASVSA
ncbi:drug resistance transporter, EmrB/QacA subfamily [Micrococcales bacterium KH10]|nr:drug resistance transporter, EmrB/QacA subfamily [Micrococcales bacterium KH10]